MTNRLARDPMNDCSFGSSKFSLLSSVWHFNFKLFIYIQLVLVHPDVYLVFIQVPIYLFRFTPCLVNLALQFSSYVYILMSKCWSLLLGFTVKCKKKYSELSVSARNYRSWTFKLIFHSLIHVLFWCFGSKLYMVSLIRVCLVPWY